MLSNVKGVDCKQITLNGLSLFVSSMTLKEKQFCKSLIAHDSKLVMHADLILKSGVNQLAVSNCYIEVMHMGTEVLIKEN